MLSGLERRSYCYACVRSCLHCARVFIDHLGNISSAILQTNSNTCFHQTSFLGPVLIIWRHLRKLSRFLQVHSLLRVFEGITSCVRLPAKKINAGFLACVFVLSTRPKKSSSDFLFLFFFFLLEYQVNN